MKKDIVVFDLDGVLFEPKYRVQHYIDGEYDQYFAKARTDEPIPAGIEVCSRFIEDDWNVLFVTGRGDHGTHREDTLYMIRSHINRYISSNSLLMRTWPIPPEQDASDAVVKPMMIEKAGYSLDRIFMVFEDRPSIVKMWRDHGITCYQTQEFKDG